MSCRTESAYEENFPGSEYTADEIEFIMAMERYKRLMHRPFPTWHEVLHVLKALGYRKTKPPAKRQPRPHSE